MNALWVWEEDFFLTTALGFCEAQFESSVICQLSQTQLSGTNSYIQVYYNKYLFLHSGP